MREGSPAVSIRSWECLIDPINSVRHIYHWLISHRYTNTNPNQTYFHFYFGARQ